MRVDTGGYGWIRVVRGLADATVHARCGGRGWLGRGWDGRTSLDQMVVQMCSIKTVATPELGRASSGEGATPDDRACIVAAEDSAAEKSPKKER